VVLASAPRRRPVCWIELDKRRPCVVVSSPEVLGVDVWQTHVVPLTSNLERAGLAGNVLLRADVTGLPRDSVAVPLGLELVDRSWLVEPLGQLPAALVDAIDEGIRAVLAL
jgi:mRNA interferase MazF